MLYTIKKIDKNKKVNCCFYCKKKKPFDDFIIKEELAEFYKGVCKDCYSKYKYHTLIYNKSVKNYKKNTLKVFNKFKEEYLRMERNYFKELDVTIKESPHKIKIIDRMFKYGRKKGYLYSFCTKCLKYFKSPQIRRDDSGFVKTKATLSLCDRCKYYRDKGKQIYDPLKQRFYRKMWENTLVIDESTGDIIRKLKLKDLNRYRRNIKLTLEEKEVYKELILKGIELSKTLGEEIQLDHIIPIRGKYVSGLNHPDNIQFLYKSINNSKNNKMIFNEGLSFNELKRLNTLNYDGFNPYLNIPFEEYLKLCV